MGWLGTLVTVGGTIVVTFVGAYFVFRGKRIDQETEEAKAEAAAATAFLQGQTAFQEYVDGVVDKRVTSAITAMQQQIAALESSMREMRRESHEMNDAIRARETQLWLWNIRNRTGPMPELPEPILRRLGIAHLTGLGDLEDTVPIHPKE